MYINDNKSCCFSLDKADGLKRDSSISLPNRFCKRNNNTVCGYVNLKNNIEEFQRSEVPFPAEILVHFNELPEGDGIILNELHLLERTNKMSLRDQSGW